MVYIIWGSAEKQPWDDPDYSTKKSSDVDAEKKS